MGLSTIELWDGEQIAIEVCDDDELVRCVALTATGERHGEKVRVHLNERDVTVVIETLKALLAELQRTSP